MNSLGLKKAQQYWAFFNNAFMNLVNYLKRGWQSEPDPGC